MKAKFLLPEQSITTDGQKPSQALVEIIQRMVREIEGMNAKLDAIAAVASPSGGATVDTQARTAIDAIRTAAE